MPWKRDDRELLDEKEDTCWLLKKMPAGRHIRPEGGLDSDMILILWEYNINEVGPSWPPTLDDRYPEIALHGLSSILPKMRDYFGRAPRLSLDGGYYTKTHENRPLIGPLPVEGAYVFGAISGYGLMSACTARNQLAD